MASTQIKNSGAKEGVRRMNEPETLDLFASAPSVTSTQIIARNVQEKTVKTQVRDITQESVDVSEPVKVIHPKENEPRSSRRKGPEKSDDAFKTISEVASQMNVPQHVLRFWETKFSQIKPMKRGGGRRYYRPRDVEIIKRIQYLLHHEGYTIKGVQKLARKLSLAEFLNENSHKTDIEGQPTSSSKKTNTGEPLVAILEGLKAIRQELNAD